VVQTAHVGINAFQAQRLLLLAEYDALKQEGSEDHTRTTHGLGAEAVFREWLAGFLPKRFGVTKGYIITPNLDYQGPLEEWDVLIYDQIESPVLFTRDFDGTKRSAIPVEYVRHIIEVKARLTPKSAGEVAEKLKKLGPFLGTDEPGKHRLHVSKSFSCSCTFFELGTETRTQYVNALDQLLPLVELHIQYKMPFSGGLIIRSPKDPRCGAVLSSLIGQTGQEWSQMCATSSWVEAANGQKWAIGTALSHGQNAFADYLFNLIRLLRGLRPTEVPTFYGKEFRGVSPWSDIVD
jgi:hypothetical protein